MANKRDPFEYDVALSFASEDAGVAEELATLLAQKNIRVFRDEYRAANAGGWGKDMVDHLVSLYARKARYCVLLVSAHYPLKAWTNAERTSARERALRDPDEFILPVHLDDTKVPGLTEAAGYTDLRQRSLESLVDLLKGKLQEIEVRSGLPSPSHDLRSGNVPSSSDTSGSR
jgi:hypothetical protein